MKIYKTCEWCGNDFEAVRTNQKFCSKECYVEADKLKKRWERIAKRVERPEQTCIVCGSKFKPRRSDQITCGGECSKRHMANLNLDRIVATRKKNKKVLETRKCIVCNKKFTPNTYRQTICGDPECKKLRARETYVKRPKKQKKLIQTVKTGPSLAELAAEAKARGISYSDLVAEREMGAICQNVARRA